MPYAFAAFLLIASLLVSGCTNIGNERVKLAQAEPLFGADTDKCLDNPFFVLAVSSTGPIPSDMPLQCKNLIVELRSYGFANYLADGIPESRGLQWRRNEVIDGLVALSNRKCGNYSAELKTFDGQTNSALSILAILTGGLGGVVGGEGAAQALSTGSAIFSGSRSALNEAWFSSQTIQVLVAGYEKTRLDQLRAITNRQACPIDRYTLMDGFGDALQYHASCSLITGLAAAAQAIERSDQPGVDVLRRQLADLTSIRAQANQLVSASFTTNPLAGTAQIERRNLALGALDAAKVEVRRAEAELAKVIQTVDNEIRPTINPFDLDALTTAINKDPRVVKAIQELASAKADVVDADNSLTAEQTKLDQLIAKDEEKLSANKANRIELQRSYAEVAVCPFTASGGEAEAAGK